MKVALVHDYLTQKGGAERVFELLCRYFPEADVYTSLYSASKSIDLDKQRTVHTTRLQAIPGAVKYFRLLAPFYYSAFKALDLQAYDLIISSTTSFAKAVQKRPDATHICFCHNITRFLWDTETYLRQYQDYRRIYPLLRPIFAQMRKVDLEYAQNPDFYVANSSTVATRIESVYHRPAVVINFPIELDNFVFSEQKDDFYLVSARLISYKRIDVIVEAFNWLGLPLLIIGNGPEREQLEAKALDNIAFLGHVSDSERAHLMARAQAVIVAALEDYGLVPIEANASGTPVISYGAGGVLDTQVPGKTGVFFDRQSPESIQAAVTAATKIKWDYAAIRAHAVNHFSETVFFEQVEETIEQVLKQRHSANSTPISRVPKLVAR
ncbi:MAG: glycosyltransferase [Cyanobacteria bacterium P01_D01_bin.105]